MTLGPFTTTTPISSTAAVALDHAVIVEFDRLDLRVGQPDAGRAVFRVAVARRLVTFWVYSVAP